ncbi:DUF3188 domain-containing protein [Microcystis elabens FACHB-917]|nr:DUF3188 domain-containing protein [Microcystis elabens FACHB-917]
MLALSSPLLILLALLVLFTRQGTDRLAAVPALVIGAGLLTTSWIRRRRRRAELLRALRQAPQPAASCAKVKDPRPVPRE